MTGKDLKKKKNKLFSLQKLINRSFSNLGAVKVAKWVFFLLYC